MRCPFPGMDPWLESPAVWPDLHDALASEIRTTLNGTLPDPYYAQLGVREELEIANDAMIRRVVPDVSVQATESRPGGGGSATATLEAPRASLEEWYEIEVFNDPREVNFVEIRDARSGHEVVTLIEILSPSNKVPGRDHDSYIKKRSSVLESTTSLVEIDLLRSGRRDFYSPEVYERLLSFVPPLEYFVLVQRAWKREFAVHYQLFPARVIEPLPVVAIPLRQGDAEATLDLQYAFQETYRGGPYARAVDYTQPPEPPLPEHLQEWATARLANVG